MATPIADTPASTLSDLDTLQATQIQQLQQQAAQALAQRLAQIRGEMQSRGLSGSSFESQALEQAQKESDMALNQGITQLQTSGAQQKLGVESQQSSQTFAADQAAAEAEARKEEARNQARAGLFGNLSSLGAAFLLRPGGGGGAPGGGAPGGAAAAAPGLFSRMFGGGGGTTAAAGAPGAAPWLAGAASTAAGVGGGAYLGQKLAPSLFKNYGSNKAVSRGAKVGSLAGAGIGNALGGPIGGALGGAAGSLVGGNVGKAAGWASNQAKKLFCFLPDTPIEMYGDKTMPIGQVRVGDVTLGGFVWSVRRALSDELYDYRGIKVTGSHAVKEDGKWIRVADSPWAIPILGRFEVVSIVTDRHRVYSMGVAMADEHETDDYETLTIDESLARLNEEEARYGA